MALAASGCGSGATAAATSSSAKLTATATVHHKPIDWGITPAPAAHRVRNPGLAVPPHAGILIDANTGEVMWSYRPYYHLPIASLTKMMTAIVSLDRARPSKRLTISSSAASIGGSVVDGARAGAVMHVGEMLRGLLIVSGNEMAVALAEGLGPGQPNFVHAMNAKASSMHLTCTHYVSPVGLNRRDVSCAYDLAVIGKAILHNGQLASIVRRPWDTIPVGYGRTTLLHNRNPLMRSGYPGIDGIKTGHTIPAGWSLVASARRGKHRLIAVLLAEDESGSDMRHLLDAGFRALKRG